MDQYRTSNRSSYINMHAHASMLAAHFFTAWPWISTFWPPCECMPTAKQLSIYNTTKFVVKDYMDTFICMIRRVSVLLCIVQSNLLMCFSNTVNRSSVDKKTVSTVLRNAVEYLWLEISYCTCKILHSMCVRVVTATVQISAWITPSCLATGSLSNQLQLSAEL